MWPYDFNGHSTVLVHHISRDNIIIDAQSIGYYVDSIYVPTHLNATNDYGFSVTWEHGKRDFYNCTLNGSVLQCDIQQTTGCPTETGEYDGTYTGYKK